MTTKLAPRLIATGVLVAGFSVAGALAGIASAHATTLPAPTVTKGANGSIDVDITATDLMNLTMQAKASYTCSTVIVPDSSGAVAQGTCTTAVYDAATTYWRQHIGVHINFRTDGTYTVTARR